MASIFQSYMAPEALPDTAQLLDRVQSLQQKVSNFKTEVESSIDSLQPIINKAIANQTLSTPASPQLQADDNAHPQQIMHANAYYLYLQTTQKKFDQQLGDVSDLDKKLNIFVNKLQKMADKSIDDNNATFQSINESYLSIEQEFSSMEVIKFISDVKDFSPDDDFFVHHSSIDLAQIQSLEKTTIQQQQREFQQHQQFLDNTKKYLNNEYAKQQHYEELVAGNLKTNGIVSQTKSILSKTTLFILAYVALRYASSSSPDEKNIISAHDIHKTTTSNNDILSHIQTSVTKSPQTKISSSQKHKDYTQQSNGLSSWLFPDLKHFKTPKLASPKQNKRFSPMVSTPSMTSHSAFSQALYNITPSQLLSASIATIYSQKLSNTKSHSPLSKSSISSDHAFIPLTPAISSSPTHTASTNHQEVISASPEQPKCDYYDFMKHKKSYKDQQPSSNDLKETNVITPSPVLSPASSKQLMVIEEVKTLTPTKPAKQFSNVENKPNVDQLSALTPDESFFSTQINNKKTKVSTQQSKKINKTNNKSITKTQDLKSALEKYQIEDPYTFTSKNSFDLLLNLQNPLVVDSWLKLLHSNRIMTCISQSNCISNQQYNEMIMILRDYKTIITKFLQSTRQSYESFNSKMLLSTISKSMKNTANTSYQQISQHVTANIQPTMNSIQQNIDPYSIAVQQRMKKLYSYIQNNTKLLKALMLQKAHSILFDMEKMYADFTVFLRETRLDNILKDSTVLSLIVEQPAFIQTFFNNKEIINLFQKSAFLFHLQDELSLPARTIALLRVAAARAESLSKDITNAAEPYIKMAKQHIPKRLTLLELSKHKIALLSVFLPSLLITLACLKHPKKQTPPQEQTNAAKSENQHIKQDDIQSEPSLPQKQKTLPSASSVKSSNIEVKGDDSITELASAILDISSYQNKDKQFVSMVSTHQSNLDEYTARRRQQQQRRAQSYFSPSVMKATKASSASAVATIKPTVSPSITKQVKQSSNLLQPRRLRELQSTQQHQQRQSLQVQQKPSRQSQSPKITGFSSPKITAQSSPIIAAQSPPKIQQSDNKAIIKKSPNIRSSINNKPINPKVFQRQPINPNNKATIIINSKNQVTFVRKQSTAATTITTKPKLNNIQHTDESINKKTLRKSSRTTNQ